MGKYDHLISFVPKPDKPGHVADWSFLRRIVWTDESFMPGAPYFEIMWFCDVRDPGPPTHTHDFDEIIGFIGGDPEHPEKLFATVKFLIDDEWYTFDKSVTLFLPAGLAHSPMHIISVEKPFIHYSGGTASGGYTKSE